MFCKLRMVIPAQLMVLHEVVMCDAEHTQGTEVSPKCHLLLVVRA